MRGTSGAPSLFSTLPREHADERIEAARAKLERVKARLIVMDFDAKQRGFAAFAPSEQRLVQEALDLLDPEVKLA